MSQWEVFVNDLSELPEDQDLALSVRTLNPGIYKYTYKRVLARVSAQADRYEDRLQVRFGRGQLANQVFSIKVLDDVKFIPDKYL